MSLSFTGQTVVITGAGGGIGKAYSLFFASRGANVVVNDVSKEAAQKVVDEIKNAGGRAVVNSSSVADGTAVIQSALDAFGGITILINNAGILRDRSLKNMSDNEWDMVQLVHLKGAFSCTKAAWPHFQRQKYGRIINTASAAGLYGNAGQANYSAAKMGLVGFTKTLAREGQKYGIKATAIAPMAASAMTQSVMPPQMLEGLKPEFVAPFVALLVHPDGPDASGKVFEIGAGFAAELRWERSKGVVFKTDSSYTPSAVKRRWSEVQDFTDADHPFNMEDLDAQVRLNFDTRSSSNLTQLIMRTQAKLLQQAQKLRTNEQSSPEIRFDGKTVIVTGAGAGLGRAYALMFGRLGANVVVNDVSSQSATAVTDEISKAGGKAVSAVASVENAEDIVKVAVDNFGTVHVLVANAGILRDKSFKKMTEQEWDAILAVHLRGTYKCAKAVWPIFQKQKYGRIVTTSSQVGIYGNFGQANYSTAKAAIIGLSKTLAFEGERSNIIVNCIAPMAGTGMTMTIWPQEMVDAFKPDFIAPIVGYLSSEDLDTTGCLFEISGGWVGQTRWQRAGGHGFPVDKPLTPEVIATKWNLVTNFDDGRGTYPTTPQEALEQIVENFENKGEGEDFVDPDDPEIVVHAKREVPETLEFTYSERDVILYNLSIGATEKELHWTFESHDEFAALPTFGVIPQFPASGSISLDFLPNYNPAKLLHGEQYLSIQKKIPTSGRLKSTARILEVLDKGNAAAVTSTVNTVDAETGETIFENQSTVFIRGAGGFGGLKKGKDRGPASASNVVPKRKPDAVTEEQTVSTQAALYRLNGDLNPLHILPEFAAIGGFDKPILHGLCTMGVAAKHVLKAFGPFKNIKVRFAGVVFPGETLITEMWKENDKIIFVTKVKERNSVVLSNAAVTLENVTMKARL